MQAKLQLVPIGQLAKFAGKKVSGTVSCQVTWQQSTSCDEKCLT